MKRRFAVFSAAILIVALLLGAVFGSGALKSRSPYNLPDVATTTSVSLGLTFSLVLNSTQLHRGQTINITAYATNIRLTPNNLTLAYDWAESWLGPGWGNIDGCNSFANAEVFQGYYTESNVSLIQNGPGPYGLQLAWPSQYECGFMPGAWSSFYPFQPRESRVGYYFSTAGYYTSHDPSNAKFKLFDPGVYTVVAGDEWGQLVLLYFNVSVS
jgi:hypothetical protein